MDSKELNEKIKNDCNYDIEEYVKLFWDFFANFIKSHNENKHYDFLSNRDNQLKLLKLIDKYNSFTPEKRTCAEKYPIPFRQVAAPLLFTKDYCDIDLPTNLKSTNDFMKEEKPKLRNLIQQIYNNIDNEKCPDSSKKEKVIEAKKFISHVASLFVDNDVLNDVCSKQIYNNNYFRITAGVAVCCCLCACILIIMLIMK